LKECNFEKRKYWWGQVKKIEPYEIRNCAFFISGFADHFLNDAFAAGHIRIPRKQLDIYVVQSGNKNKYAYNPNVRGNALSGSLTQALHNLEGKMTLKVKNSLGIEFEAKSDNFLSGEIKKIQDSSSGVDSKKILCSKDALIPALAIQRSLNEVLDAYLYGNTYSPFNALELVPFPTSTTHTLTSRIQNKVNNKNVKEAFIKLMHTFPTKLRVKLEKKFNFSKFVKDMDKIMASFRAMVINDINNPHNQDWVDRLPQEYKESFKNMDKSAGMLNFPSDWKFNFD